jgi:hypothetical protein
VVGKAQRLESGEVFADVTLEGEHSDSRHGHVIESRSPGNCSGIRNELFLMDT